MKDYKDNVNHMGRAFRKMVMKELDLGAGHWFECQNGHLYAIGECGGAVEESKCPECNAVIGGRGYQLNNQNR